MNILSGDYRMKALYLYRPIYMTSIFTVTEVLNSCKREGSLGFRLSKTVL